VRISVALPRDLVHVLALERDIAEAPHWSEAEYSAIAAAVESSVRRRLLLAWEGGELVGFAVGKVAAAEAELESVAVRASSRRCGVGRALCEAVLDWVWEQGARISELEVRASSVGAIELYAGLGFEVMGRRRRYYREPDEDAVLMRLERPR